jgi:hypothetical protein
MAMWVMIYSDRDSKESHTSADMWIPLEIKEAEGLIDRRIVIRRRMVTVIILCQQQRPY